ncbi:YdgH/BhsA/McbA-like domain containing protein [Rouxiella badensis]|jgi:hypothetical protein|uniref:YdgH/BhsA/McbA-like domain containing protein n=1 Tax=Rouxiella badensis TaxID=1646377 RepID=UPI003C49421B
MKSVRFVAVAVALLTISSTSFAAAEISKYESTGLKSMGSISVIQNMGNIYDSEISRKADSKNADFYVITSSGSIGNGSNSVIKADIFSKN